MQLVLVTLCVVGLWSPTLSGAELLAHYSFNEGAGEMILRDYEPSVALAILHDVPVRCEKEDDGTAQQRHHRSPLSGTIGDKASARSDFLYDHASEARWRFIEITKSVQAHFARQAG